MAGVQDQLEIKFRLTDGSDIGPKSFPAATSVVNLKESILAQWPKEKDNGPRTVKDVKLISAGRILENNRTVAECRSPLCDVPGGVTTMHVVVQPPSQEKETDERAKAEQMRLCYIITFAAQIVGITSFLDERELELIKENEMDQLADRFSSIGIMQASCHMSYALTQVRRTLFAVKSVGLCYITHSCLRFLCKEFLCCICIHVLQSNLFHSPCIIFNRTILEIILCQGIGKALDGVATVLRYALRCVVQQNAMPPQLGP